MIPLNVLVACEFSGVVRDAFRALGHNAWSCDLIDPDVGKGLGHVYHFKGDARRLLRGHIPRDMVADSSFRNTPAFIRWDMLIHHTPCTYAANSGVRWLYKGGRGKVPDPQRWAAMRETAAMFREFQDCDIPHIAGENPIPHRYAEEIMGRYTQVIQPWMFGHGETKATCLWLKNLPMLTPTKIVEGREARVHRMPPGEHRGHERSRTLPGIGAAMAEQWSGW